MEIQKASSAKSSAQIKQEREGSLSTAYCVAPETYSVERMKAGLNTFLHVALELFFSSSYIPRGRQERGGETRGMRHPPIFPVLPLGHVLAQESAQFTTSAEGDCAPVRLVSSLLHFFFFRTANLREGEREGMHGQAPAPP